MSTPSKTFLTPEQYLEIERKAEFKSQYYNGEMFAMAGARSPHNLITTNVTRELSQQLRPRPCLEIERKAEFKSQYYNGEMFAMAGARSPHNLITTNVTRELSQQLRPRPCL